MTRDEIMELAQGTAGWHWMDEAHIQRFAALIQRHLIASGYRKCAVGQRTTQFCGQLEQAVLAERETCIRETERLAVLIAAAEREACAKVAENGMLGLTIAAAIRARGEK